MLLQRLISSILICYFLVTSALTISTLKTHPKFTIVPDCTLRADPTNASNYLIPVYSAYMLRPCPDGTQFNQNICSCQMSPYKNDPSQVDAVNPVKEEITQPLNWTGTNQRTSSVPVTQSPQCPYQITNDKSRFLEYIIGFGWVKRSCPPGTQFFLDSCMCLQTAVASKIVPVCEPDLNMHFQNEAKNKAGNKIAVGQWAVKYLKNGALFTGNSYITLWRFRSAYFGNAITIQMTFKEIEGPRLKQVLLSNCNREGNPSIEIALYPKINRMSFQLDTKEHIPVEIRLKYQPGVWKNVTMAYDGAAFYVEINNKPGYVALDGGNVETRSANVKIGQCSHDDSFTGIISMVKFYRCVPRELFAN